MKPTRAWALLRDGILYEVWPTKKHAEIQKRDYEPGSKHEWRVVRVEVREVK